MQVRLILSTLSFFLAVSFSGTAQAQAPGSRCDAKCLAVSIMGKIPEGERIALIPFGPPTTDLPREDSDFLYKQIVSAMHEAKHDRRHEVVSKDLDRAAWSALQAEQKNPDYEELWNQRRVGVTIHCNVMGVEEQGVSLLCRAIPVGKDSKLKGEVAAGRTALLPGKEPFLPYRYRLTKVARSLVVGAEPGEITNVFLVDNSDGQQTKLTAYMGTVIRRVVGERFQELLRQRQTKEGLQVAIGGDGPATTSTVRRYELRGRLEWLKQDLPELSVQLLDGGEEIKTARITLRRKWLPRNLIEEGTGRRRYSATGHALRSDRLSKADAEWVARNAARVRIVAQATGRTASDLPEMRTAKHGIEALRRALKSGVTTQERLQSIWEPSPGVVAVRLRARVVKVGATLQPAFEARLTKDRVRAREAMHIHLSAKETLHVGVFAWGADHNVFLVFPRGNTELVVPEHGEVVLPRGEDNIVIASQPLRGRASDDEAIIVIAATKKLPLRELAPLLGGATGGGTPELVSGAEFLRRLGQIDLSRAGISVLPYTVTR